MESFQELDAKIKFNFKKDLYSRALTFHFTTISGYVFNAYYHRFLSLREMGKELGLSSNAIMYWMNKWGFKKRPMGGNTSNKQLRDPEVIQKILSLEGKMSSCKAAKLLGVCHDATIRRIWRENKKQDC